MDNIDITLPRKFWAFIAEAIDYRIKAYQQELSEIDDEDRIAEIQNDLPLLEISLKDIQEKLRYDWNVYEIFLLKTTLSSCNFLTQSL